MEIKQIDDSQVDEIIKRAEREGNARREAMKSGNYDPDAFENSNQKITMAIIIILVIISLVQSYEIISLKKQLRGGQYYSSK